MLSMVGKRASPLPAQLEESPSVVECPLRPSQGGWGTPKHRAQPGTGTVQESKRSESRRSF